MPKFQFVVTIECDTVEDAENVIGERLGHDEICYRDDSSAIEYSLDWRFCPLDPVVDECKRTLELLCDYGKSLGSLGENILDRIEKPQFTRSQLC